MNILNSGLASGLARWRSVAPGHHRLELVLERPRVVASGRRGQPWWFVIMLVINTVGILEIIYLFVVLKLKFSELFKK